MKDGLFTQEAIDEFKDRQRRNMLPLSSEGAINSGPTKPISPNSGVPPVFSVRVAGALLTGSLNSPSPLQSCMSSTLPKLISPKYESDTFSIPSMYPRPSVLAITAGSSAEEISCPSHYDQCIPSRSHREGCRYDDGLDATDLRSTSPLGQSTSTVVRHGEISRDHIRQTSSASVRTRGTHEREISVSSAQSSVLPVYYQLRNAQGSPSSSQQGTSFIQGPQTSNLSGAPTSMHSNTTTTATAATIAGFETSTNQSNSGESTASRQKQSVKDLPPKTSPPHPSLSSGPSPPGTLSSPIHVNPNAKRKMTRKEKTLARLAAAQEGDRGKAGDTNTEAKVSKQPKPQSSNPLTALPNHGRTSSHHQPSACDAFGSSLPIKIMEPPVLSPKQSADPMQQYLGSFDTSGTQYYQMSTASKQLPHSMSEHPYPLNQNNTFNNNRPNVGQQQQGRHHTRQLSAPPTQGNPNGAYVPLSMSQPRSLLPFMDMTSRNVSLCHSRQTTNDSLDDSTMARIVGARVAKGMGLDFSGSQTASPTLGAEIAAHRNRHHISFSTASGGSTTRYRHDPYGITSPTSQNPMGSGSKQLMSTDLLNAMYN